MKEHGATPAGAPAAVGSLSEGFAAAVRAFPRRVAVREGPLSLTYRELDARSRALAAALRARGARPGRPVGILLERSADLVAAALAVLRTGASYVPLDPAAPRARLEQILRHTAPQTVVTAGGTAGRLPDGHPAVRADVRLPPAPEREPAVTVGREAPAYLLVPPGTTGPTRPVQVSHGTVLRLFARAESRYGFGSDDIWTLSHSFASDIRACEMWGALLYGGCAVVVPPEAAEDPKAFRELLRAERVTVHLSRSPAAVRRLIAEDSRAGDRLPLKCVVLGDEAPHAPDLGPWRAKYGDAAPRLITLAGTERRARTEPFALTAPQDRERLTAAGGIEDAYPVTALQTRMLLRSTCRGGTDASRDLFVFRLRAAYDHDALTRAVDRAVDRHDILRTSFHLAGYREPLQLVHRHAPAPVTVRDLRGLPRHAREAELAAWPERARGEPYSWAEPPLARFHAHVVEDREFLFSLAFHGALLDAWSQSSLITEILADFWALRDGGRKAPAPRPAHRFADCVARERRTLGDRAVLAFWSRELDGSEPAPAPWPADAPAGPPHEEATRFGGVDITPEQAAALDAVARHHHARLRHVLLAVHARAVAVLTGREDVLLGVECDGRRDGEGAAGGARAIGLQQNVMPYRLRTGGRASGELIRAVQDKEQELAAMSGLPCAGEGRPPAVRRAADILFACTDLYGFEELAAATDVELLDAKTRVPTGAALRAEFTRDPFTRLLGLDLEADGRRVGEELLREAEEIYRVTIADVADAAPAAGRRPPHSSGTR